MPEISQATLNSLLRQIYDLQFGLTAVANQLSKFASESVENPKTFTLGSVTINDRYKFENLHEDKIQCKIQWIPVNSENFSHVFFIHKCDGCLREWFSHECISDAMMEDFPEVIVGAKVQVMNLNLELLQLTKPESYNKWRLVLPQVAVQLSKLAQNDASGSLRFKRFIQCLLPAADYYYGTHTKQRCGELDYSLAFLKGEVMDKDITLSLVEALHEWIEAEPNLNWQLFVNLLQGSHFISAVQHTARKIVASIEHKHEIMNYFVRLYTKAALPQLSPTACFYVEFTKESELKNNDDIVKLFTPQSKTYARWLKVKGPAKYFSQ